jgi:hypothetical protein
MVVLDAGAACNRNALAYPGAGCYPTGMADKSKYFLAGVHVSNKLQDAGIAAQLVRGPAARHQQAIELFRRDSIGGSVAAHRQPAAFAGVSLIRMHADDDHRGALFADPHIRHPEFEVFEPVGGKDAHVFPESFMDASIG